MDPTVQAIIDVGQGLNKSWMIICGAMVMSMQVGFAWLEAGAIRRKNQSAVYYKLTLNLLITVFTWWVLGYAFAFGDAEDKFIGGERFYAGAKWGDAWSLLSTQYAHWTFQLSIAAVVPAITGGVIAERATLKGTAVHTFLMTLLIYPYIISWTWGEGWMMERLYYKDFTGSGMVHCTGAFAGLAGLIIIGPRYGKNDRHKNVMDAEKKKLLHDQHKTEEEHEDPNAFTLANIQKLRAKVNLDVYDNFGVSDLAVALTGALFLWLGFIFFNAGSSIVLTNQAWVAAEKAAANTFLGGAGAAFIALAFKHPLCNGFGAKRNLKDDAATVANAYLGGMVANGAGMNTYWPWEALVVGMIGGIFYTALCVLFEKFHWDDALEAFQLHGGCGTAGVWAASFFNHDTGIFHHGPGKTLGRHILVWLIISFWSFAWSFIIFWILNKMGILRVDLKTEIVGYDYIDFADHLRFDLSKKIEVAGAGGRAKNIQMKDYEQAAKTEE